MVLVSPQAAQQSVHLTLGILRHFQAFFYALAFFRSDGVPPPAPAQVTQAVSCFAENQVQNQVSFLSKICRFAKVFFSGGFRKFSSFICFGSGFQLISFPNSILSFLFSFCRWSKVLVNFGL